MRKHPFLYSVLVMGIIGGIVMTTVTLVALFTGIGGSSLYPFGSVAVIEIEGPIFDSSDTLKEIEKYKKNKAVKAVVVRINSPGGAVAPSQEIFEELKKLRQAKKVVVSMGSLAASGAYYIAVAADKILASPGTVTGSIGVLMESFSFQDLIKWAKIESRVIKSGTFKDIGSPFRVMEPAERQYLQGILDNLYMQFKQAISEQRKIPLEKMDQLAEGKIYTGQQAVAAGLIDGLGTLYDAVDEAKKLAGLSPDARVIWPREDLSPFNFLSSELDDVFVKRLKAAVVSYELPLMLYRNTVGQ